MQGRGNLTPVGLHRIQGKCSYLCFTWNALLLIAVCPAQDALLGIVSIYKAGQTYKGQKKSYSGWNTKKSRQMWLSVPCSEAPTLYNKMFCSGCPTWNSIYNRKLDRYMRGREFTLRNAVIWSTAFRVGHAAIQSYPKYQRALGSKFWR